VNKGTNGFFFPLGICSGLFDRSKVFREWGTWLSCWCSCVHNLKSSCFGYGLSISEQRVMGAKAQPPPYSLKALANVTAESWDTVICLKASIRFTGVFAHIDVRLLLQSLISVDSCCISFIVLHSQCPPWLCRSSSTQRSSVGSAVWDGLTLTRAMSVGLVAWLRLPCRAGFRERENGRRDCPQLVTALVAHGTRASWLPACPLPYPILCGTSFL
jgi:hypothetical protein